MHADGYNKFPGFLDETPPTTERVVIEGDFFSPEVQSQLKGINHQFSLVVADPPYGKVVAEKWDQISEQDTIELYTGLMRCTQELCIEGAAAYIWGGIGSPGMRPFFKAIPIIEETTRWKMSSLITWKKKRAYGTATAYLFTREELAYFVLGDPKKPHKFNIPLLEEKRGYAGYSAKYPANS